MRDRSGGQLGDERVDVEALEREWQRSGPAFYRLVTSP